MSAVERGGPLVGWAALVTILTLLNVASRLGGPTPKDEIYTWGLTVSSIGVFAFILAWDLVVARHDMRGLLALRRPDSWATALVLAVILLVAVTALSAALEPLLHAGREQGLTPTHWRGDRASEFVANVFVIAVVAPIVEELTFRGLGYSVLIPFGRWTAIIGVGIAFAAAHGLFQALPVLFFFGAGLAYIRDRTKSVYPGMLVHATYNAAALILAVTT